MPEDKAQLDKLYERAHVLRDLGQFAKALDTYNAFLASFSANSTDRRVAKALIGAVKAAAALARWADQETLARRIISAFPDDPNGPVLLNAALIGQGRQSEARQQVKKAVQAADIARNIELYERALALRKKGRLDGALDVFQQILARHPDTSSAPLVAKILPAASAMAIGLERWSDLENLSRRAVVAFPDDPAGREHLIQALAAQGREAELPIVIKTVRKAAGQARQNAIYEAAMATKKRGKVSEALQLYFNFLDEFEIDSTDSRVVKAMKTARECAVEIENWTAAETIARRKMAAFPREAEGCDDLAEALDGQGRGSEATAARIKADHLRGAARPAELTILTVVLDSHYRYIAQQLELIEALNPATPFKLLVVDNTGSGEPGLQIDHPRCQVLPGIDQDQSLPEHGRGSYHHAAALNMALKHVDTPWLLVLDPDFFVVYRNWIDEVHDHMTRRRLSLFGVPWHYGWNRKWRYFPCVHFLMIDLQKIGLDQLDFTPALLDDAESSNSPVHLWMREHAPILRNRLLLESRRDTGWRLHRRFRRTAAADMALPVVETRVEFRAPARLATAAGRWLEQRLPSRMSFLPKPGTYLEPDQATGFRYPPIRSLAPERFVWRGAPFAVHLRGNMREDMRTSANPPHKERAATKELLDAVTGASSWAEWAFSVGTSD